MDFSNICTILFLLMFATSILLKLILDIVSYLHRKKHKSFIPEGLNDFVDSNKLEQINSYANEKLKFSIIEYITENILLIAILLLGIIPRYYSLLTAITANKYLIALLFFGGYTALQTVINLPFSLYYNFVIEKKYDFNKMTFSTWISDLIKGLAIGALLGAALLLPLIFFLYTFTNIWWILLWGFISVFSFILQIVYPSFIAPLFNKFVPLSNQDLKDQIEKMLTSSGFKPDGVFEMDASKRSSHSNAYFAGIGKTKRIVIFDTLLQTMSNNEIVAVLAHEIGHFKKKHILKRMILSMTAMLAGLFLATLLIDSSILYEAFKLPVPERFIGLFLISILVTPLSFFITPISSMLSRKDEYEADLFAAETTGSPESLRTALIKINIDNLSTLYPAEIYAWFYYSHPPLYKRIQALESKH